MSDLGGHGPDIGAGRLAAEDYARNFSDLHPALTRHEAFVEADRCYFCFDAPCMNACPTHIDVPLFIRQIQAGNPGGAAATILESNIIGGMCARVCPVETLCEEACVRNTAEDKPVKIGELQRYATDVLMDSGEHPFARAAPTGRRVAVVGAGPAGLSCAHRLAMHGHAVTIYDARPKAGGLNEYGIAAYKTPAGFAAREVDFILKIGGIAIETGQVLGRDFTLADLKQAFDAVFLAMGLAGVNALGAEGEDANGALDAVAWIAELRQTHDLGRLPIGRRVVVIGGGMTAIDAAVQSKLLGAEEVTIVYRRGQADMKASRWEQELAQTRGVRIMHWARPLRLLAGPRGNVHAVAIERTRIEDGRLVPTGEIVTLPADMVFKAIGQTFLPAPLDGSGEAIRLKNGRIEVDAERRTSMPGIWAGGDCIAGGEDLTVAAAEDGKRAAESIHRALAGEAEARMSEIEAGVAGHYGSFDVLRRIRAGLAQMGYSGDRVPPEVLAAVDEFHIGGTEATRALLARVDIGRETRVLDVGSGIGGPARSIARDHGCHVTGIDLTPAFVEAARALTAMTGVQNVRFETASATAMPFADASFDLALLLHVGMNIPDKAGLFREVRRVLREGGTFAVYDVMRLGEGELTYPVPWAETEDLSALTTPQAYREAAEAAGFILAEEEDCSAIALDFFARIQAQAAGAAPAPLGLHTLMGPTVKEKVANMVAAIRAATIGPMQMIFRTRPA